MKTTIRILLAATWLASPALADEARLVSTHVQYPQDDKDFTGPGAELVNNNCLACHSAEMILAQPKLSDKVLTAEVNKMRTVFKAPIAESDVQGVVDYLVKAQAAN